MNWTIVFAAYAGFCALFGTAMCAAEIIVGQDFHFSASLAATSALIGALLCGRAACGDVEQ